MSTGTTTPPREGDELVDAAARGAGLTGTEENMLLQFFLGDAPQPNSTKTQEFAVDTGDGKEWTCSLGAVTWGEYRDATTRSTSSDDGTQDFFKEASYVVARATKKPLLGPIFAQVREARIAENRDLPEDQARAVPEDAAHMLRIFFERQPGSLIYLRRKVLELSRLDEAGEGGVREIEAGKTSS